MMMKTLGAMDEAGQDFLQGLVSHTNVLINLRLNGCGYKT